jgi:predicted anti-sigma-YlaC factor YlaD
MRISRPGAFSVTCPSSALVVCSADAAAGRLVTGSGHPDNYSQHMLEADAEDITCPICKQGRARGSAWHAQRSLS